MSKVIPPNIVEKQQYNRVGKHGKSFVESVTNRYVTYCVVNEAYSASGQKDLSGAKTRSIRVLKTTVERLILQGVWILATGQD